MKQNPILSESATKTREKCNKSDGREWKERKCENVSLRIVLSSAPDDWSCTDEQAHLDLLESFLGGQISHAAHLRVGPGFHRSARISILLPKSHSVLVLVAKGIQFGPGVFPSLHGFIYRGFDTLADLLAARFLQRLSCWSQFFN